jgi:hypothetical protein
MKRPFETWSSMEICSATRSGSCHGSTTTIEPSWMRSVRPAKYDRNCRTSGTMV